MSEAKTEAHRKLPQGRGMRIVLFASLALNLAVAGVVAGFLVMGPPPPPRDRPGGDDPALPYTRALSPEQRGDLRDQLRGKAFGDRREMADVRRAVLADYQRAVAVLRADPFDPAALEALMVEQAARSAEVRARGHAVLSSYVAQMTAEERAAYADRLEETLQRFARKGRGDDKDGRGDGPRHD